MLDESRITKVETRLDFHDQRHEDIQAAIQVLAKGIDELVRAEARRQGDKETFDRIFASAQQIETSVDKLRKEFEEYKGKLAEKELDAYKTVVWKVAGLAAIVIASVIAGHLGGKWLG